VKIKIEGIHPYDGSYDLDFGHLTNRDIRTIKQVAGLSPLEYEAAGQKGDNDFILAMTIIALRRSGQFPVVDEDVLLDAEIGRITVDVEDEAVGDDGPPALEPETRGSPSGSPSPTDSATPPARILRPTGTGFSEP